MYKLYNTTGKRKQEWERRKAEKRCALQLPSGWVCFTVVFQILITRNVNKLFKLRIDKKCEGNVHKHDWMILHKKKMFLWNLFEKFNVESLILLLMHENVLGTKKRMIE